MAPETDTQKAAANDEVRLLARALFSAQERKEGEDDTQFIAHRAEMMQTARKVLRILEKRGYALTKSA